MRRHIILFAVLSVGLLTAFLPQVKAGQPGGQTIGGHERQVIRNTGVSKIDWACASCEVPACVTVAAEDGEPVVHYFTISGVFSVASHVVQKDNVRTTCTITLQRVEVECPAFSGTCKYHFRVDQIGPPVLFDIFGDPIPPPGN